MAKRISLFLFISFFAVLISVVPSTAFVNTQDPVLSSYLVPAPNAELLQKISEHFDIEHRHGVDYEVIVPAHQADQLLAIAPNAHLMDPDLSFTVKTKRDAFASLAISPYRYHQLSEVQNWMKDMEGTYPQTAKVLSYGTSQQGRPLLALRLTSNIQQPTLGRPELLFTAATHGDELITTEVLMNLVNRLLAGYGNDARLTSLVDRYDLYFIPVVNPDGFASVHRYDNGADPNRSYPYPDRPSVRSTASIKALIDFFHTHQFAGSIDFHAYGELVMYPWGYTTARIDKATDAKFDKLTTTMANTNRYTHGPIATTIYVAKGSSADYYFWKQKTAALAIEVGQSKVPSPTEFPRYFESQVESTWLFIESF